MVVIARQSLLRATGLGSCMRANAAAISPAKRMMAVQQVRLASSATTTIPGTSAMSPAENIALLNEQRLKRPNSPHLAIYQPQLTWYLSSLTRITGVALSGSLYLFSLAYLLHPSVLTSFDSAHIVQFAQDLPGWVKGSIKLPMAGMFFFHTFNGIRHLAWDIGYGLTLKGVYAGGYAVLAATAVASVYCSFFL